VNDSPLSIAYRRDLAISHNNLGMLQSRSGDFATAEKSFGVALKGLSELLVAQPADVQTLSKRGAVLTNLGLLFEQQNRLPEAETAFREAGAQQTQAYRLSSGSEPTRELLVRLLANLAKNLRTQGKFDAAVEISAERANLSKGRAEELLAVAQELAATYGEMNSFTQAAEKQRCVMSAVSTLREALSAGLSRGKLQDAVFDVFRENQEFKALLSSLSRPNQRPTSIATSGSDVAATR
jgi:tetratricopeptide (TPR) repeat protein